MGMTLQPVYPTKSLGRADFDIKAYMSALKDKGYHVTWEQHAECPCSDATDDHQPLVTCPVCLGRGEYWHTPQDARVLMTRFEYSEVSKNIGEFMPGAVYATFAPEQLPGIRDRFTLQNSVIVYTETLERVAGTTQAHGRPTGTRYPITSRTMTLNVAGTSTETTVHVTYMRKNGAGGYPTTELTEGTDFTIDASGDIVWTLGDALGTAPAVGVAFTITYFCNPRYMVLDYAHVVRDTHIKEKKPTSEYTAMPSNMLARLDLYLEN